MSDETLLDDLEAAAKWVDCCDRDNCRANDGKQCKGHHMSKRLRSHAARLREEMEHAEKRERDAQLGGDERMETIAWGQRNVLTRINGGAR